MARATFNEIMAKKIQLLDRNMKDANLISVDEELTFRAGNNSNGYPHRVSIRDIYGGGERTLIEHDVTVKRSELITIVDNYTYIIEQTRRAGNGAPVRL